MKKERQKALIFRLEKIRNRNKEHLLQPDAVVKEALAKKDPVWGLPDYFWDDKRCAAEHRVYLVRDMIASVEYDLESSEQIIAAPYYVHKPGNKQGYEMLGEVKSDENRSLDVLRQEFGQVIRLLERALAVADVIGMKKQTLRLLNQVKKVYESVA
jgi:hypothetical protein